MAICTVYTGNSAGVNVRASKSTNSKKLGVIDNGVQVNVVRCDSTWATLMYNGTPAFVQHQYLNNPPASNGEGLSDNDSAVCNGSNVNVRDDANGNTTGSQLNKGDAATVYERSELISGYYWYRIGTNRWVRGDYLTPGTSSSGNGDTGAGDNSGDSSGDSSGNSDDPTYVAGQFGRTTATGVRVRTSPGADNFVKVVKGSMFYIEGTQTGPTISGSSSNVWVKIRFGKGDGTYESRYIHSSCFGETLSITASAKTRIVAIAQTLVNNTGGNLGMGGDWCQRFIYWLCAASGLAVSMPYSKGYCGEARLEMVRSYGAEWHQRGDGYKPVAGDLIYFGELGSDVSSHVGLVYQGGNSFKTVEGNLSDKVQLREGSVATGKCGDRLYQGFLRLSI